MVQRLKMFRKINVIQFLWIPFFWLNALDAQSQDTPKVYHAPYLSGEITIDGHPDQAWVNAEWTDYFMDIQGPDENPPRLQTRVKMMWDEHGLYLLVWLEEDHLWADLVDRDAIIFWENDFEVFVKPDTRTDHYFEYEINARNTLMDLLMTKPYNQGGKAILTWNSSTVRHAVMLEGTLNNPTDTDRGWWVELMIPYRDLMHFGADIAPAEGKSWRINFSRVQWQTEVEEGRYVKRKDQWGRPLPEDNWVWSPQYEINMHIPEHWGTVRFVK